MTLPMRRLALAVLAGTVTGLVACGPTEPTTLKHPMVGTWDVTTTFTSYNGPDTAFACTDTSCPHKLTTPDAASSLHGTLVIADSVVYSADSVIFPVTIPVMTEADCALASPCASRTVIYLSSTMLFVNDQQPRWSQHVTNFADTLAGEVLRLAYGRYAGDSIAGTVAWFPVNGRKVRTYSGTFVARRQR